jgi:hypothetical protein
MFGRSLLFFTIIICCLHLSAQKKDMPDSVRQLVLAVRYHSGFIFAHSIQVKNTKGTHPDGFEFEISHLRSDAAMLVKYKCYPRSGLSFTYVDFNNALLGKSYSVSYFLEPNYRLGNQLRLIFRAAAGLSYLTNPHDSIKNPQNYSYSGNINCFLQLGLGLSYPLNNHFSVYAMGNFFHNSNGGFEEPNSGVNYINASFGIQYYQHSTRLPVYQKEKDTSWKHEPLHIDVSAFYSPKVGYNSDSIQHRKFVLGTSLHIIKKVSNLDAITVGAEIYYDDGMRSIKEVFIHDSSSSNTLVGVLIGHQFLFNRFLFTQELGVYVFKQTDVYNTHYRDLYHDLYHRWGIYYNVKKRWSIGINLLAHNQIADFIDGRAIYRLR